MIRKTLLALFVLATTLPHAPSAQAELYTTQWFYGNWTCKIGDRTAQMNWLPAQNAPNSKYIGKFRENGGSWTPLSEVARGYNTLEMRFDRTKVIWKLTYSPPRYSDPGVVRGTTIVQGKTQPILCKGGGYSGNSTEPIQPTDNQPGIIPQATQTQKGEPDRCQQGYVWREADATDRVCVTPAVRTQTRTENSLAAERREPNGGAYGPNTCKQGFVWREAVANDVVCVPPEVRTQAAEDNKQAGSRRVP
jgi:hypothetical protein